ncbi:hypothetical protein EDB92DRAFT_1944530 [Lactarius akahatsu]|uniref:Uncharacterized protein n=1 Tax=Lactarius akahatsu TaxID=416441 RepID=A0AAD4Q8Y0_9AGAM|nr:hypothetical protein EDB92DRAFT_1944530 [Lactarius akahatsu]
MGGLHPTSSLRRADVQPTHVSGFGRNMGDSPMVVVWPSRGPDGEYNSVALLQRKAPYEVMPTPDPHPPFTAKLSITDTYGHRGEPSKSVHSECPAPHSPLLPQCISTIPAPIPKKKETDDDEKAEDEGESHDDDDDAVGGGSASFVHGALCTVGSLLAGSPRAFLLHRLLQFGVAGASITGGSLAYLFMDNHGSSMAHKVGGAGLVLLYVVQCAIGSWVHRIPGESRTGAHGALLAGLGGAIVLLAFFETWLGLIAAGQSTLVWSALLLSYSFLPYYCTRPYLSPENPDPLRVQRPALRSPITSDLLTTEDAEAFAAAAAADVDLPLSSADESRALLPPDRTASNQRAQHGGRRGASLRLRCRRS